MTYEVCKEVKNKLEKENIRLEYSSLLNSTNQFIFRQEDDDFAIIVPRKINMSEIEATWTLAHEYGHYLVRTDKEINDFNMSRLEIEILCWERGKLLLKEINFPIIEDKNTYDSFAERCLATYKIDIKNYKHNNINSNRTQSILNIFAKLSSGSATLINGIIIAYILLTTINLTEKMYYFLGISILINIVALIFRYIVKEINKNE